MVCIKINPAVVPVSITMYRQVVDLTLDVDEYEEESDVPILGGVFDHTMDVFVLFVHKRYYNTNEWVFDRLLVWELPPDNGGTDDMVSWLYSVSGECVEMEKLFFIEESASWIYHNFVDCVEWMAANPRIIVIGGIYY